MYKKIKIVSLEKTQEYLKKEINNLNAYKKKLLKDCDWTQLPDCGLRVSNIIEWRIWRYKLRNIVISENIEKSKQQLDDILKEKPILKKRTIEKFKYILNDLDYFDLQTLKLTASNIIEELYQNKNIKKNFYNKLKDLNNLKNIETLLVQTIDYGY